MDSLIKEFKLPEPHFVKMDVEGAEFSVLQGAVESLENIVGFYLETNVFYGTKSSGYFHDIYHFLAARNFALFDINSLGYRPTDGVMYQVYTTFLNKRYEFRDQTPFTHNEAQQQALVLAMKQRRQHLLARNEELLRNW